VSIGIVQYRYTLIPFIRYREILLMDDRTPSQHVHGTSLLPIGASEFQFIDIIIWHNST
jgi:hypothetical protein